MNIIDYCEKNNILWRPIKIEVSTAGKKKPKPLWGEMAIVGDWDNAEWVEKILPKRQESFRSISKAEQDKLWIAIDTRQIYQFDIDHLEENSYSDASSELVKMFLETCPYYNSGTKVLGKHAFFKLDKKLSKSRNKFKLVAECQEFTDLEILSGCFSWSKSTTVVENSDVEIPTLNYDELPLKYGASLKSDKKKGVMKIKFNPHKKKPNLIEEEDLDKEDKIFKYADIINMEHIDDYATWLNLLIALKSENKKSIAKFISSKSAKFNLEEFEKKWESITEGKITIGTLYHYAKISDKKKYDELLHKDMDKLDFIDSDDTQAKLFLREMEDNLVYKDGSLYIYIGNTEGTKGRWHLDDKLEKTKKISSDYLSKIQQDYLNSLKEKSQELVNLSDDGLSEEQEAELNELGEKEKWTGKLIAKLKNCAKINSVCERLRSLLSVLDFNEIEFDVNPYLFPFNNTCYDLKSHNWVGTRRDNYILSTSGYNWRDPTDDEMKKLTKLIEEIFQEKTVRKEYIHLLATGLFGVPIEKFIFAFGSGGNGKGVINELMMKTCGKFGYLANNAVLLNPLKDGANPAIANMGKKRFINYREPDEKKSINLSAVKELTGGSGISARKCYSNDDEVGLVGTHICELNKKCPLVGDLGASVQRRLRDIPFETSYSSDKEMLDADLGVLKSNPFYKSAKFQEQFKFAMFAYLTKYALDWQNSEKQDVCEKLYESDIVSERTKAYIEDNDEVFGILKRHFVKDLSKKSVMFVKFGTFWTLFKDSDFYKTLSKADQNKTFSEKSVMEHLKNSTATKMFFKSLFKTKNKSGEEIMLHNVLKCWRPKTQEETYKEECDSDDMLSESDTEGADDGGGGVWGV